MPRYKIVVITGETDWETFQNRILRNVLRALTSFPAIAVRFGEYTPDQNGAP